MPVIAHSIDDGEGRYGSRTRVNRIVFDYDAADLAGQTAIIAAIKMNGEIHTMYLDTTISKLTSNTDTQTTHGSFSIECGDYSLLNTDPILYCNSIGELDFTNKGSRTHYKFQTNEGAAMQGGSAMEHSLSVSVGRSAHSAPATPKIADPQANQIPIDGNQPWTGRVCGTVNFKLETSTAWAADTGKIRLTIIYS